MIITRSPLRISIGGGGTDLPSYYRDHSGFVISAAIDKYVYITIHQTFAEELILKYSQMERVKSVDEVQHPIIREALKMVPVQSPHLEIASMADIPAGTGLGSSGSFTTALLKALYTHNRQYIHPGDLAKQACEIELDRLKEPIGKQDQYIAAHGGLQFIQFQQDGSVFVDPVVCPAETRRELNRRLLMFFTGATRNARDVLVKQRANTQQKAPVLRRMCDIARELRDILTCGTDLNAFGRGLHEAWEAKKCLEASVHNAAIDEYYDRGRKAGSLGGKILGAGGGGFMLFFCEPHLQDRLRAALPELTEVPFSFEPQGSKVILLGSDRW